MSIKVLIIEDSQVQAIAIVKMLRESNEEEYSVDWAPSYQDAMEFFKRNFYDVALVDYNLENSKNGIEIIKEVVTGVSKSTAMIIVTATDNVNLDRKASEAGASGYMVKKFLNSTVLERSIRYAIERKRDEIELLKLQSELEHRNNQMEENLNIAAEFQKSILSPMPVSKHFEFGVKYIPCGGNVSGDVYHTNVFEDGSVFVFLGDATGHGVAAAMQTMMIHIGLDSIDLNSQTNKIIAQLNSKLAKRGKADKFVTSVLVKISPHGVLQTAHAGHPPLLIFTDDCTKVIQAEKAGLPLGLMDDSIVKYEEEVFHLKSGDRVFIITDGITELTNQKGEMFEQNKLISFIKTHRKESIQKVLDNLILFLKTWSHQENYGDDLSIIGIEYNGE